MARSSAKELALHSVTVRSSILTRLIAQALIPGALLFVLALLVSSATAADLRLEMELERWAKLREAERYQLNIAEKYFRDKNYKVAQSEYEKFITLYDRSEGAPYAQLKWSVCLVERRQLNTAIKDGYQSIIDYWPDSPEAVKASYFIARTYKDMAETRKAKKAYAEVLERYPKDGIAAHARSDLADIARVEKDTQTQVEMWKALTFDTERTRGTQRTCEDASRALASYSFGIGAFNQGRESLQTTYPETPQLAYQVYNHAAGPIRSLTVEEDTKAKGERLADEAIAFFRSSMPTDKSDEELVLQAKQHWYYIADTHSVARRPDEVPKVYDLVVKQFGVDDTTLGRLAAWYKTEDRRDEARATYGRFENEIEGKNQLATMYREEKRWDSAVNLYRQLVTADEENPHRWQAQIGETYLYAGKCDEAVGAYRQLLTDDAERAGSHQWRIGEIYRHFGRYKEAVATYRQCENYPSNYNMMAWCHRRMKEWNEALVLYNQVAAEERYAPAALYQIAHTYEEAGEKEKAIRSFQRVCERFPKDGHAAQAHAILQDKYKISVTLGGAKGDEDR